MASSTPFDSPIKLWLAVTGAEIVGHFAPAFFAGPRSPRCGRVASQRSIVRRYHHGLRPILPSGSGIVPRQRYWRMVAGDKPASFATASVSS